MIDDEELEELELVPGFLRLMQLAYRNLASGDTAAVLIGSIIADYSGWGLPPECFWAAVEIKQDGALPDYIRINRINHIHGEKLNRYCRDCILHATGSLREQCTRHLIGLATDCPDKCPYILEHTLEKSK